VHDVKARLRAGRVLMAAIFLPTKGKIKRPDPGTRPFYYSKTDVYLIQ